MTVLWRRRRPQRYVVDVTWYPGGESRVEFVFHRRTPVSAADRARQRQDGVHDPSAFDNVEIGRGACPPGTAAQVQEFAFGWLEQVAGADRDSDSFVVNNWTAAGRDLVTSRSGGAPSGQ